MSDRSVLIQLITFAPQRAEELGEYPKFLQDHLVARGLKGKVIIDSLREIPLRHLGIKRTPTMVIDGVRWLEGALPTEMGLEEILARFFNATPEIYRGHVGERPIPTSLSEAASLVLDMMDEATRQRLCELPEGEAIRVLDHRLYHNIVSGFHLRNNSVLQNAAGGLGSPDATWAVLLSARTLALHLDDPANEKLMHNWWRILIISYAHREKAFQYTISWPHVSEHLKAILDTIDHPRHAWWLVNLGIEIGAAGHMQIASMIIDHAMRLGEALEGRIQMVQALVEMREIGPALDYLKGFSPRTDN